MRSSKDSRGLRSYKSGKPNPQQLKLVGIRPKAIHQELPAEGGTRKNRLLCAPPQSPPIAKHHGLTASSSRVPLALIPKPHYVSHPPSVRRRLVEVSRFPLAAGHQSAGAWPIAASFARGSMESLFDSTSCFVSLPAMIGGWRSETGCAGSLGDPIHLHFPTRFSAFAKSGIQGLLPSTPALSQ